MSQGTSSRNPDTMEVDASHQGNQASKKKTHNAYLAFMKGKCFGCGSKEHNKKDGNHEHDICQHCGKPGHRSTVCRSKSMGKAATPPAKVAGTEAPTSGPNPNGPSTSSKAAATTSTLAKDSKTQADLLAQLMKRVEAQDAELKALNVTVTTTVRLT